MKIYKTRTMGETILIQADNRKEAYAKFFLDIKKGKYPLEKIGGIIMVEDPDDGEDYPFRTTPTLWLMDLIPSGVAFATIENMLDLSSESDESAQILIKASNEDKWILDEIAKLENLAREREIKNEKEW